MKFTAEREKLLTPLQAVIGVVERRQTMPVLANGQLGVRQRLRVARQRQTCRISGRTLHATPTAYAIKDVS
jgi:DNA polymerase III beta subunit, N-terminal domain